MTWNEYIDVVINIVKQCSLDGVCYANHLAYNPFNYVQVLYYNSLNKYMFAYANLTDTPRSYYFWPIEDRQSRILFLKSLKEAE